MYSGFTSVSTGKEAENLSCKLGGVYRGELRERVGGSNGVSTKLYVWKKVDR